MGLSQGACQNFAADAASHAKQYLSSSVTTRTQIRSSLKWGGAILAAIFLGLLVHSWWATIGWTLPNGAAFGVEGGSLAIAAGTLPQKLAPPPPGWIYIQNDAAFRWWIDWGSFGARWYFGVPLWMPILICAIAAARAWRKEVLERRRNSVGLCRGCGYDRRGIADGAKCPECGKLHA